jgi:hypothetical protein
VKNRDLKEILVVEYSGSKHLRSKWVCDHVMMTQLDVLETVGRISPISKHQGLTMSRSRNVTLNRKKSTLTQSTFVLCRKRTSL